MIFEEALRTSIKAYFEGKLPTKYLEAHKDSGKDELRYTPEYFDELEEELIGKPPEAIEEEDEDVSEVS